MNVAQSDRTRGAATGPVILAMMKRRSLSCGEPSVFTTASFRSGAEDHNNLAAAAAIGASLSEQLGLTPSVIDKPEPALSTDWRPEL